MTVDFDELEDRGRCRKRYGRATLTIRRSGGWAEFMLHPQLGRAIALYDRGEVSAEEVCSAFVRARVETHSPSFTWKTAELERVLPLVCECSDSPTLESTEPEQVARALVLHKRAVDRRQRELTIPVVSSIERARRAFESQGVRRLMDQQRRQAEALRKALGSSGFQALLEQQRRQAEALQKATQSAGLQTMLEQHRKQAEALRKLTQSAGLRAVLEQQSRQAEALRTAFERSAAIRGSAASALRAFSAALPATLPADSELVAEVQPVVESAADAVAEPTPEALISAIELLGEKIGELSARLDDMEQGGARRDEGEADRFALSVIINIFLFLLQWLLQLLFFSGPPPQE